MKHIHASEECTALHGTANLLWAALQPCDWHCCMVSMQAYAARSNPTGST